MLFVNGKLQVANDVDEQDIGDLELDFLFNLVRHTNSSRHVAADETLNNDYNVLSDVAGTGFWSPYGP